MMQSDYIPVPQRNALMIAPHALGQLKPNMFAKTQVVNYKDSKWVVVPLDDVTYTLLRRHGMEPPSPMDVYYTWPGRWKPFDHQRATAKFLAAYPRAFVFNEFGTGKTLATLWALDYLMSRGLCKRAIITAPLSTLERVWGDALWESFHHRKYKVLHGSAEKRKKLLAEPADFYVINHDGMEIISDELKARDDITHCVVDELAIFRNQKTGKFKTLWKLYGPDSNKSFWGLTGAPMPNSPTDVWSQARLVNPALVPKFFTRFRDDLMTQVSQFRWVPKRGWEDKVYSMLQPSIRFTTDQALDLPPITTMTRQVEMSAKQKKMYNDLVTVCKAEAAEGTVLALNEGVKINKLLQCATGVVYTSDGDIVDLEPTAKLNELVETVLAAGRKAIVFTPYKHSLEMLRKKLKSAGFSVGVVSGDVSANQRNTIFSEFQDGDLEVIAAHPKCMAHGLTLTAASTVIWYAPIDDFEIYEQANARVRRAGQTQKQFIVHIQSTKVEEKIYQRLQKKEKMQGILLDLLNGK